MVIPSMRQWAALSICHSIGKISLEVSGALVQAWTRVFILRKIDPAEQIHPFQETKRRYYCCFMPASGNMWTVLIVYCGEASPVAVQPTPTQM